MIFLFRSFHIYIIIVASSVDDNIDKNQQTNNHILTIFEGTKMTKNDVNIEEKLKNMFIKPANKENLTDSVYNWITFFNNDNVIRIFLKIKFPNVINLNVGGYLYTTSLSTLTKYEDSMLAVMFSGRHEIVRDENGRYFIDRDGKHFRWLFIDPKNKHSK